MAVVAIRGLRTTYRRVNQGSTLHGGLVLAVYSLVVLGVSGWMFRRRDIT